MNAKLGNQYEQATQYVNAAGCIKSSDPATYASLLKRSVLYVSHVDPASASAFARSHGRARCFASDCSLFCELGRFNMASKTQKDIGEMYEAENNLEEAIAAYELAAEYYNGEGAATSANKVLLKVALFSSQLERYDRAIEIFERVAASSLDNTLTKFSVKEYFLQGALCHLCTGELVAGRRALERYLDLDLTFHGSREAVFLDDIMQAIEADDVDLFTSKIVEYDRISKLNHWKTTILLRIKNSFFGGGGGADDGSDDRL